MRGFALAVCLMCASSLGAALCWADPPCAEQEEKSVFQDSLILSVDKKQIAVPTQLFVSLQAASADATDDGLTIVRLRFSANVENLKRALPGIMKSAARIPGSNCNNRYTDKNYFVHPTGGNAINAGFDIDYQQRKCVFKSYTQCPTTRKPFRQCKKAGIVDIGDKITTSVRSSLSAKIEGGQATVVANTKTKTSDIPKQFAFLGAIFGSMAGNTLFGAAGGAIIGKSIQQKIEKLGTFIKTYPLPTGVMPQDAPINFSAKDAAFAGVAPTVLNLTYNSQPIRPNTACFIKNIIVEKGLPKQ